jgi:hypothetical protein
MRTYPHSEDDGSIGRFEISNASFRADFCFEPGPWFPSALYDLGVGCVIALLATIVASGGKPKLGDAAWGAEAQRSATW